MTSGKGWLEIAGDSKRITLGVQCLGGLGVKGLGVYDVGFG